MMATKKVISTSKKVTKKTTTPVGLVSGAGVSKGMKETASAYTPSAAVNAAQGQMNQAIANKPASYQSAYQSKIDDYTNKYLNRDKFNYDFNTDAIYKQYKDNYTKQANMGMQNTMAQAAAQTGGYGNSYAATAGNLAYQNEMSNLNNIIPELYSQAYSRYQDEGNNMLNAISLLQGQEDSAYGKYRDSVSDYQTDRGYYTDAYNTERNFDYGKFSDQRNYDYQVKRDDVADNQDARNFAYQVLQDSISNDLNERQFAASLAASKSSGGSGGSRSGSGNKGAKGTTKSGTGKSKKISSGDEMTLDYNDVQDWLDNNYKGNNALTPEEFNRLIASNPKLQKFGGYDAYLKWKIKHPTESNTL